MNWIRIATCDSIPPREGRAVLVGERQIAIFNLGDRFLAVDNECPHQSGPLCDGIVAGDAVVCPLHAWKVCLSTGEVKRPAESAACTRSYAVEVVDGIVVVQLASEQR